MPATNPWMNNATFPCELGLRSTPDGLRITRRPIAEIEKLYDNKKNFGAMTLPSGANLFSELTSEACDIDIVVDLTRSTASKIDIRLADVTVTYDVAAQTLLGHPLPAVDGKVEIRLLRDWAQLEVFGNDGLLSYTRFHAFTPGDGSLSITGDGDVAVVSCDFRNVKRTWPD
jgi:sucrose-6-phosphate hydrolase SacC (GH32 family)